MPIGSLQSSLTCPLFAVCSSEVGHLSSLPGFLLVLDKKVGYQSQKSLPTLLVRVPTSEQSIFPFDSELHRLNFQVSTRKDQPSETAFLSRKSLKRSNVAFP